MAFSLGALIVDFEARTGKFETDTGRAAAIMKKRAAEIDRTINRAVTKISKYTAAAAAGLAVFIVKSTKEAEAALAQLDAAVKSTGGAAGFTTPQLVAMSNALQKTTVFADDVIQAMQSVLLTFTRIKGPEFEAAQQAIVDISSRLGKDLQSSAILVGKALNDPIKGMGALAKAGIQFSDAQEKTIKSMVALGNVAGAQGVILGELKTQFGGAAAAARNTFGGALSGLTNAFGHLFEVSAEGTNKAKDSILGLTSVLQDPSVINGVQTLTAFIVTLIGKIGEAIAGLTILFTGKGGNSDVNLDIQIDKTKSKLDSLKRFGAGFTKQIRELQDEYDVLIAKQQVMLGLITPRSNQIGGGSNKDASTKAVAEALVATEQFEKQSAALQKQIAMYGAIGKAAEVAYDIKSGALDDIHPKEQQHLLSLAKQYDLLVKNAEALKLTTAETEALFSVQKQADIFSEARLNGPASQRFTSSRSAVDEAKRLSQALSDVGDENSMAISASLEKIKGETIEMGTAFEETVSEMSVFAEQAARNIESSLADFLFHPFDKGLKGMLRGFVDILRRMVAEAASANILKALGGGTGGIAGFFGKLLGGFGGGGGSVGGMASGGFMPAGMPKIVGERGPELWMPNTSGTITAAGKFGGVTIDARTHVDARGATTDFAKALPGILQEHERRLIDSMRDGKSRGFSV